MTSTRTVSQAKFETLSVLRNGEQLLLSIIFPLGLIVFLTKTPCSPGSGSSRPVPIRCRSQSPGR